jgi:cytoskeletal protein RodZ
MTSVRTRKRPDKQRTWNPPGSICGRNHRHRRLTSTRESLGQRLRAARESRGWSDADVASRLHLPIQIVQKLEADRFDAIGHRIYLRGYLTSYVRLLDLPTILVESVLQQHQEQLEPPPLTTTGTISHSRTCSSATRCRRYT